ncbi:MAG: MFS transporter [Hyphomicrobiaceae bacterium]
MNTSTTLAQASRKVRRRLLPFLIVCYFVSYLDRVNIGFAALTMNADLGIGPEAFGFVAGIFFIGYCLFEVPSNIALAHFGARIWIARIMISWGLVSMAMALVSGPVSLAVTRFLLGVAEAGFFPGIIYYLTRWVPAAERASTVSAFMAAVPVSALIGAPLSGLILDAFAGVGGLAGWQWLFILEAAPAILLGLAALSVLKDEPKDAPWLTRAEADVLTKKIAEEDGARQKAGNITLTQALTEPRVLALSLVYFGIVAGLYSLTFWTPQIVKAFGLSNSATGLIAAIPFLGGALVMYPWGRHSDRQAERIWHVAIPCFVGAVGLIAGTFATEPVWAMAALVVAALGIFAALPTFWALPTALLSGTAAAAGIALINSIGNIGGFAGPYAVGWLKAAGLDTATAVAAISALMFLSGAMALIAGRQTARAR